MPRAQAPGGFHRRGYVDAHRAPQEQPLAPEQAVDGVEGPLVVNAHGVIHGRPLQVGRHAAVADALGDRAALADQLAGGCPAVQGAAVRVRQHTAHLGILLLEIKGHAGIGTTGTGGRHPGIHLASGLDPDLRAGAVEVGAAVGKVVELVGPHGARGFGRDAARQAHVVVGVAVGHRRHRAHLRPQASQQADLLGRLGVGNHDQRPVAPGIAKVGEADAGVAGGALHHGTAGLQQPLLFRLHQDPQGGTVLHGTAGIHEFRLAEHLAAGGVAEGIEPY